MSPPKTSGARRGTIRGASSLNLVTFTIRATPLPKDIVQFIFDNISILTALQLETKPDSLDRHSEAEDYEERGAVNEGFLRNPTAKLGEFWEAFDAKCQEAGSEWKGIVDRVWAFGPHKTGGCILIDSRETEHPQSCAFSVSHILYID